MVNNAEQAQQVVYNSKFPPRGGRSFTDHRLLNGPGQESRTLTDDSLVILQIETEEAANNVEAIAQTPGVDGIFLGPDDLRMSLGLSLDVPLTDPLIVEILTRTFQAAQAAGIMATCWGSTEPQVTAMLAGLGYSLIAVITDKALVSAASAALSQDLRNAPG